MNPVIKKKVMETLNTTSLSRDDISRDDILKVTELNLNNLELTDISDLSEFKNLIKLSLNDNYLNNLTPLVELTKLEELYAWNDPFKSDEEKAAEKGKIHLSDMSFLKNLTKLHEIDFTYTGITDIEWVKWLPNIEIMRVYCNKIPDISPISVLKKLKQVFFFDCGLSDISVFKELPDITGVAINMNKISDLTPLINCKNITYLDAHTNQIADITALSGMTEMRYLTLAENNISDISALLGMTNIISLTLGSNPNLKDFSILKKLKTLKRLDLRGAKIGMDEINEIQTILTECNIKR